MKIGIVGLPNVGKSTLFNALTKSYAADAANFPFCTIEPNEGLVNVRDPRIDVLSTLSKSEKIIYATTTFVDIAGLVRGASTGEGLGNKFLSHIRETDAIVQVLRYFQDSDVTHVEGTVDPMRDVEIINTELIMSDLEQIIKKIDGVSKKAKSGDKESKEQLDLLTPLKNTLEEGKLARELRGSFLPAEEKFIKGFNLLTYKPFIYVINVSQDDLESHEAIKAKFADALGRPCAIVSAKVESEMMEFSDEERAEFLPAGVPTLDDVIALAYKTVGLMYYFTTGEKETRAWSIPVASTAPKAAGAIHGDFEKGFIKAEVVGYSDLVAAGSRNGAKEAGKLRLEGKEYVVQDGDVMVFRFSK